MKRINDAFIESLIDNTDLVSLIGADVELKKAGKNYLACCPFHNEKTPSFNVKNSGSNSFYICFGCKASGNALNFLQEFHGIDFVEAVERLAAFNGVQVEYSVNNNSKALPKEDLDKLYDLILSHTDKANVEGVYYIDSPSLLRQSIIDNGLEDAAVKMRLFNSKGAFYCYAKSKVKIFSEKGEFKGLASVNDEGKVLIVPRSIGNHSKTLMEGLVESRECNDSPLILSPNDALALRTAGYKNLITNWSGEFSKGVIGNLSRGFKKPPVIVLKNTIEHREATFDIVRRYLDNWRADGTNDLKVLFIPNEMSITQIFNRIGYSKFRDAVNNTSKSISDIVKSLLRSTLKNNPHNITYVHEKLWLLTAGDNSPNAIKSAILDDVLNSLGNKFEESFKSFLLDNYPEHWAIQTSKVNSEQLTNLPSVPVLVERVLASDNITEEDYVLCSSAINYAKSNGLFTSDDISSLKNVYSNNVLSHIVGRSDDTGSNETVDDMDDVYLEALAEEFLYRAIAKPNKTMASESRFIY